MKPNTGFLLFILLAVFILSATMAHAATFNVTKFADTNDGACDADCSLREAVIAANADAAADTIELMAGEYILTITGIDEDDSATGDLDILNSVTIEGRGQAIVNANSIDRVFHIMNSPSAPEPSVIFNGLTITDGSVTSPGGGIYARNSTLTIRNSIVNTNSGFDGGGISIFQSTSEITNSTVRDNLATQSYGGGVFFGQSTATITNSTISWNSAPNEGGGVYVSWLSQVSITGSTININNSSSFLSLGGGISNDGQVTITSSTISNNTAHYGGGIYSTGIEGQATITSSTISGNTANGDGGGVYVESGFTATNITNSTISGNTANDDGGGVFVYSGMTAINIINSTISVNSANYGGGIYGQSSFNIGSTILSGNTAVTSGPDCYRAGTLTSLGYNLVGYINSGSCTFGTTDITGLNPLLNPLADNGGPTMTHALQAGSPAIDTGNPSCVGTDQRGAPRPIDGDSNESSYCDIGAFELQAPAYSYIKKSAVDMGSVETGEASGPEEIRIYNMGYASLDIFTMQVTGPDASDFSIDAGGGSSPCGTFSPVITSFGYCTLTVTFSPSSPGAKDAQLHILASSESSPDVAVVLSGTGVAGLVHAISLSSGSLHFGSVSASSYSDKILTLTNNGSGSLNIGIVNGSDPLGAPFSIVSDTCSGKNIAASGTCDITVRFEPSTLTAAVSGIGGLGIIMLGMVLASGVSRRRKTLAALLIGAVMVVGLLTACGTDTETVYVKGDSPGYFSDTFNIPSNDPDTPNITVNVSGSF
jgi:CSLREA domain-containing protein